MVGVQEPREKIALRIAMNIRVSMPLFRGF